MNSPSPLFALACLLVPLLVGLPEAQAAEGKAVSLPEPPKSEKSADPSKPAFLNGAARWYPPGLRPAKWEWVLLNTGEWLKGTIDSIRNDRMEFDSDKFDKIILKMKDVVETHSSRVDTFVFTDRRVIVGVGRVTRDSVLIDTDSGQQKFPRTDLISLAVGDRDEIRLWSGSASVGLSSSSGNTNQTTANLQASISRRGAFLRLDSSYYANFGETNGETNVENQQLMLEADLFIRDRFYLIPAIFEYYTDIFSNISLRIKPGAGVGYEIARTSDLDWHVSVVGQYQRVDYFSTPAGQNPTFESFAATVASQSRWDITSDITFSGNYSVTIPTAEGASPDQQGIFKLEIDITKYLTLNTTLNWTRIGNPTEQADGETPEPNDVSLSFGLGLDF